MKRLNGSPPDIVRVALMYERILIMYNNTIGGTYDINVGVWRIAHRYHNVHRSKVLEQCLVRRDIHDSECNKSWH